MDSVKSQSMFDGRVSRNGEFQGKEAIAGELVLSRLMSLVSPGLAAPPRTLAKPLRFTGLAHSVIDGGEVTHILLEKLPSNELLELQLPTVISLGSLDGYTFSTCPHYTIEAYWDAKVQVWSAFSENIPGLATEADTLEALREKLRVMIPELLELNEVLPEGLFGIIIDLTSHHQDLLEVS